MNATVLQQSASELSFTAYFGYGYTRLASAPELPASVRYLTSPTVRTPIGRMKRPGASIY